MSKSILIIEDEETLRESLGRVFSRERFHVETVDSAEKGLELTETTIFDVIISDIILPGIDGIEMLTRVRQEVPDQVFIIVTAYASLETAIQALRAGAYDYIMKPVVHEEIKQVVKNALRQKLLETENFLLKREIGGNYDFSSIIGQSPVLMSVIEEIRKVKDTRSNVLLLGETGTGKELFARIIHHNSARKDMPFIPINCSVIPENLLESELFGHLKGAFTGAVMSKKGLFEEADGGTVFLDEIGDINPFFQIKLLRVLEEQIVRPVGSTKSLKVDIRVIAATNKDIADAVRKGGFREDLFYRINTITLKLPPLRERKDDISLLIQHFLEKYSAELGKHVDTVSDEALSRMVNYHWPGNIRELQNVIERSILISDGRRITTKNLPVTLKSDRTFSHASLEKLMSIEEYTKAFIHHYQGRYNELQLSGMLGITRKSLWEKRKKWGIERNQT